MIPQRNLSLLSNRLYKEHGGRRIPEAVLERDFCRTPTLGEQPNGDIFECERNVRAVRPPGVTPPQASSGGVDAKHARLLSAFTAAVESGDLNVLTQLLASDVRVITDGGGKVRAALNAIDGADRVANFLVEVTRKRPDAWWREDFTRRFALVNGLPGVVVDSPEGPVQTTAFEIEGDVVKAIYVVRNPDKLRHLAVGTTRER